MKKFRSTIHHPYVKHFLPGATLALVLAGCGGGGDDKTPDTAVSQPKLDAAVVVTPDTAVPQPKLDTGVVVTPDTALAKMDTLVDPSRDSSATGGQTGDMRGTGGTPATGGALSPDGSTGGQVDSADTATDSSPGLDIAQPSDGVGDVLPTPTDAGPPSMCPKTVWAQSFGTDISYFTSTTFSKEGSLLVGGDAFRTIPAFLTKPLLNGGSNDPLLASIRLTATKDAYQADWVYGAPISTTDENGNPTNVGTGDGNDQFLRRLAISGDGMVAAIGDLLGSINVSGTIKITNASSISRPYILGLNAADGGGKWGKAIDLGGEYLYAVAGNPMQNFFVACGAAKNAAPSLAAGLSNKGGKDVVVAAFNATDGQILWAKMFGGAGDDVCGAAAIDDQGNIFLAGDFSGALDFGTGPLPVVPQQAMADGGVVRTSRSLFVAKLSATGDILAATSFGTAQGNDVSQSTLSANTKSIAVDSQGNAVVVGQFKGTPMLVGATSLVRTSMTADTFVIKLGANLTPQWARRWGNKASDGAKTQTLAGMAFNSAGNLITAGTFQGEVDFGTGAFTLTSVTKGSGTDLAIVQLSGSTGETTCALDFGQPGNLPATGAFIYAAGATTISVNRWGLGTSRDQVVISGNFVGTLDFGAPSAPIASGSVSTTVPFILQMQP